MAWRVLHARMMERAIASVALHVANDCGQWRESLVAAVAYSILTFVLRTPQVPAMRRREASNAIRWRREWKSKASWQSDGALQVSRNSIHLIKPRKCRVGTTVRTSMYRAVSAHAV